MKLKKLPACVIQIKFYPFEKSKEIIEPRPSLQTKKHLVRELNYKPTFIQ